MVASVLPYLFYLIFKHHKIAVSKNEKDTRVLVKKIARKQNRNSNKMKSYSNKMNWNLLMIDSVLTLAMVFSINYTSLLVEIYVKHDLLLLTSFWWDF